MKNQYPKLPKAFKKKWLEALRSGIYKQGTISLKNYYDTDDGKPKHCCLGVACEVAGQKDVPNTNFIPSKNRVKNIPSILKGKNDLTEKLANMNDGEDSSQRSFKQIANWIEKNL